MRTPAIVTLAALLLLAPRGVLHAEPEAERPRGLRPELNELKSAVYRSSCLSVAQVVRETEFGKEVGSGFFIGEPGHFVTVLSTEAETKGLWVNYGVDSMRRFEAEQLAADPYTGLALLRVEGLAEAGPLTVGDSTGLESGDYLYAVAETEDPGRSCAAGRLAGREKWIGGRTLAASVMRLNLDAPAEAFGSPVLDRDANLVGVLLLGAEREGRAGVNFALPVEHVAKLLRDYQRHGRAAAGWLGMGMAMGSSTPEIVSLREESPAAKAGLQVGDVILSIGDRRMDDYQDVIDACYVLTPGEAVKVRVLRGLDDAEVGLVPGSREEMR